jgi:Ca2+-binding RTX toxin-like protein
MRKHGALIGALAAVATIGATAQPAFAGDLRVDTSAGGVKRLLFTEPRIGTDPTTLKGIYQSEPNSITITQAGGVITVADSSSPITAGAKCTQAGANQVQCPAVDAGTAIALLDFSLGGANDSFNNQTAINASVMGGPGSDRIVNSGAGNDTLSLSGQELDQVDSCGGGTDTADLDHRDVIASTSACETITVDGKVVSTTTPPPAGSPPPPPITQNPINASPAGTPAPVSNASLGVVPTAACVTPFIGTAGDDRIDGSSGGDREFGQAGNDYLRGQLGDDCLYGLDGKDTLIGDEGDDLLVGGNGDDQAFGGLGKDRLYGNNGVDRLYGNLGDDRLSGGLGNDRLSGGNGNDQLFGGLGNDLIDGGLGNDVISGGPGRDHIIGGLGSDRINGGPSSDIISAGSGNDRINARDHRKDVVRCGPGRDTVVADTIDTLLNCERVTRRR